jgi:hypothetical protein
MTLVLPFRYINVSDEAIVLPVQELVQVKGLGISALSTPGYVGGRSKEGVVANRKGNDSLYRVKKNERA